VNADGNPVTRRAFGTVIAYIDDIAVCTFGTVMDHEVFLRRVLARMQHSNLQRLQPKKCDFFRRRADFLGHVLSEHGIQQQERKVAAIRNWPALTDLTSIRAFTSMCSYYRRFVKDFAKIAQPLTDLLRKDAVIQPLPAQALEAFEKTGPHRGAGLGVLQCGRRYAAAYRRLRLWHRRRVKPGGCQW